MVSTTFITTCILTIPQFPRYTSIPGTGSVPFSYAYAPSNTNWVGGTSCGLSFAKQSTYDPLVSPKPTTTYVKCSFPTKVGSFAVAVTPFIKYSPVKGSLPSVTSCDPIPAASLNAQKFSIRCPSVLGNKMYASGLNTFSFRVPQGAPSIAQYAFYVVAPTTKTTYLEDKTKAKTNLIPTTVLTTKETTTITYTQTSTPTSYVYITTGTSTYTCTVTASSGTILGRSEPTDIPKVATNMESTNPGLLLKQGKIEESYEEPKVVLDELPSSVNNSSDIIVEDHPVKLSERTPSVLVQVVKRAPSIGRPDFTYPPIATATIYVSRFSTSTFTCFNYAQTVITPPPITKTWSVLAYKQVTVTVEPTPGSSASLLAKQIAQKTGISVSRIL